MRVHVLGFAAGGGFPQWNCNCRNCAGLRQGAIQAQARTQSSIAIGAGEDWDAFVATTDFMRGAPAKPWWAYTKQRKAVYGAV